MGEAGGWGPKQRAAATYAACSRGGNGKAARHGPAPSPIPRPWAHSQSMRNRNPRLGSPITVKLVTNRQTCTSVWRKRGEGFSVARLQRQWQGPCACWKQADRGWTSRESQIPSSRFGRNALVTLPLLSPKHTHARTCACVRRRWTDWPRQDPPTTQGRAPHTWGGNLKTWAQSRCMSCVGRTPSMPSSAVERKVSMSRRVTGGRSRIKAEMPLHAWKWEGRPGVRRGRAGHSGAGVLDHLGPRTHGC